MNVLKLALTAVAATVALGGAAMAQDTGPTVAYNIGVVSDYVFRGISQTNEDPAIQGGIDVSQGPAYLGVWASNVDFNDSTQAEVDLYGGYKFSLGAATLDLGAIYYGYIDAPSGADYGNFEGKAAISGPVGPATLGAAVFYSPDSFGAADEAAYYELNGAVPVGPVTVSGAVGAQTYKGSGDYNTWNLGASYTFADHFTLDGRYYDTDEDFLGQIGEGRFVVALKAAF
jgi:uncharacterized protein (TIGR02001 family)